MAKMAKLAKLIKMAKVAKFALLAKFVKFSILAKLVKLAKLAYTDRVIATSLLLLARDCWMTKHTDRQTNKNNIKVVLERGFSC